MRGVVVAAEFGAEIGDADVVQVERAAGNILINAVDAGADEIGEGDGGQWRKQDAGGGGVRGCIGQDLEFEIGQVVGVAGEPRGVVAVGILDDFFVPVEVDAGALGDGINDDVNGAVDAFDGGLAAAGDAGIGGVSHKWGSLYFTPS